MAPLFHFPRPRSVLHLISLRTATEFITFTLAVNKVTGLYGILALFTGYHLNILQLSHYIYSLVLLGLVYYLSSSMRQKDANGVLKTLALAWIYVLDTVVSSAYTALFGLGWFVLLAQHLNEPLPIGGNSVPGATMMNDTAGFTTPEHSVSHVDVVATPAPDAIAAQQATTYGYAGSGTINAALWAQGSIMSVTVLGLLWVVRFYFCIIVLSYARSTVRHHVAATSANSAGYSDTSDPTMAENPFRCGRSEGEGWRGKLGRFMLRFPTQRYWLGKDESEEEWARQTSSRLESARGLRIKVPGGGGVGERERRARSGTGPPVPLSVKDKAPQ